MKAIVVDIDGTLSDPSHRRELVEGDRNDWEGFFSRVSEDEVNDWCKEIIDRFKEEYMILLVTGRPKRSKDGIAVNRKTRDWLFENDIHFDDLIMREEGDFRKDTEVKQEIFDEKLPSREEILFALDDREDIAEMWRSNGVVCLQTKDEVTE